MRTPIKVIDIELSHGAQPIRGLEGYNGVQGLVRWHGIPLGSVRLPLAAGSCAAETVGTAVVEQLGPALVQRLVADGLASCEEPPLSLAELMRLAPPPFEGALPPLTVAVCTRDRAADLERCLAALMELDYPQLEILVVDNAPSDDTTRLVAARFPQARYVCEPRPGLDWARNRAIDEARGEILAFTDDDVIVDPGWARALGELFGANPEVMCVTGLVVPYELATEAQQLFEIYGGFGRGFERKWYRVPPGHSAARIHGGTGKFGTGANMAYRRRVFDEIGGFDPALDVGTATNGGGDLEMFFRILKEGHTLVYEPRAIVRHRHRREYPRLRTQIANNGVGFYSYLVRSAWAYPDERAAFIRLGVWWLWWWSIRRLLHSLSQPLRLPRELAVVELRGSLVGLTRYQRARRRAAELAAATGEALVQRPSSSAGMPGAQADHEWLTRSRSHEVGQPRRAAWCLLRSWIRGAAGHSCEAPFVASWPNSWSAPTRRISLSVPRAAPLQPLAVRAVDLARSLPDLSDVAGHVGVRVVVTRGERLIGSFDLETAGLPVRALWLREAIAAELGVELLEGIPEGERGARWSAALAELARCLCRPVEEVTPLPSDQLVSIVIATHDRPASLEACLRSLGVLKTRRPVEVIVVDNHPASGLTPPVVARFPHVHLVHEERKGLSYARNAGIAASRGAVVVAIDDDVVVPPTWLEMLVAPFARPDVMAVTGNVLPLELETLAQERFEAYGGLGRGYRRREVDATWFESFRIGAVPTWQLGATANAAFRATIFADPAIGMLDEALGAGTPTGCSEDTDLFYRVLRAGHTMVYEPSAFVWHQHRRDQQSLRRQIYAYSKGHVAYLLKTLLDYRDARSLVQLLYWLPRVHLWRLKERLRGRSSYPISFTLLEIAGNLAGPAALWRSRQRVRELGRAAGYPERLELEARAVGQIERIPSR